MAKKVYKGLPIIAKRSTTDVVPMKLGTYKGSQSTQKFFDGLENSMDIEALKKVWKDNGQPDVRTFDPAQPSITDRLYAKHPHYNPLSNTISIPFTKKYTVDSYADETSMSLKEKQDAANIANRNRDEGIDKQYLLNNFTDELSHAKQFNGKFLSSTYKSLTNDLPDFIKGKSPYEDPKALEYEAHSIITPQIQKDLSRTINSNNMKSTKRKMATGGFTNWANKNQAGISAVGDYGSAVVDAFAPTDAYGVRSDGASIGSGALSGAAKGAAIGSSVPIIGTAAGAIGGAIVGGITGLLGNDKAKKEKDIAIEKKTTAQLAATQAGADARIAGDPGLKYGRMAASYYRFGGVMKGTPATLPRKTQPMATVQAKPRLMPNITESPMRQMSRKANGGSIDPLSSSDIKVEGASHENGGVKFPSLGVELEGGETVNNGFVFSKKLGFAKPAEAIAKQLGKAEKRPETAINTSTINALKRKTELLKAHQEVAKEAAGIPSDLPEMADGGPIIPRDSTYRGALVQNGGRTINQQVLQQQGGSTGVQVVPMPIDYNRNFREFQMGVPGRNLPVNPTPAIIRSPTGRTYKNGGIIKKMAAGGFTQPAEGTPVYPWDTNPITGLIDRLKVPTTELPEVNITTPRLLKAKNPGFNYSTPKDPFTDLKPIKSAAVASKATESEGTGFNDVASKIAPFVSNFVNATQKLPLPPVPQLNTEITPNLVDYSSSRNEAVRANRSANASARTNLNSGAAVSASVAANLAGQTRAVSQINEAENNANAQIRNSTAAENAQIKADNTALQNNYQNELVQRQIKGQSLASANIANLEEKVQGMAKDKKLFNLEGEKAILRFLSNNDSGAGYDAARPILEKHLTPDQMKQMDVWATKARADGKAESLKNLSNYKMQADYLRSKGVSEDIINGISTITPGKGKKTSTVTETKKVGNTTIKKTTAS